MGSLIASKPVGRTGFEKRVGRAPPALLPQSGVGQGEHLTLDLGVVGSSHMLGVEVS